MTKRSKEEHEAVGTLGAYAVGGAGLAGARLLSGLLAEGRSSLSHLGPEPIGSDPWLLRAVRAAIGHEKGIDASHVVVEVHEAIVKLTGSAKPVDVPRIEAAARTVQGIKALKVALG